MFGRYVYPSSVRLLMSLEAMFELYADLITDVRDFNDRLPSLVDKCRQDSKEAENLKLQCSFVRSRLQKLLEESHQERVSIQDTSKRNLEAAASKTPWLWGSLALASVGGVVSGMAGMGAELPLTLVGCSTFMALGATLKMKVDSQVRLADEQQALALKFQNLTISIKEHEQIVTAVHEVVHANYRELLKFVDNRKETYNIKDADIYLVMMKRMGTNLLGDLRKLLSQQAEHEATLLRLGDKVDGAFMLKWHNGMKKQLSRIACDSP